MNQVFWIPQGCELPYSIRYGDDEWPYAGDLRADPEIALLARETPASGFVLLTGRSGHGKSLLARALTRQYRPSADAPQRIVSGTDFKRGYHQSLDTHTVDEWRCDWLKASWVAIDGLDQLLDNLAVQHALETLLDEWQDGGTFILITASALPAELIGITPRLASRCAAAWHGSLSVPGPAAREWLVGRLFRERGLPSSGVHVEWLLEWWEANRLPVPAIRGLAIELAARASSFDPAELRALAEALLENRRPSQPTIDQIARLVARRYAIPLRELRGDSRKRNVVRARGTAIWLARKWTGQSYHRIGDYFQKRDHTTILHAWRTFEERLADPDLRRLVECLEEELSQTLSPRRRRGQLVTSLSDADDPCRPIESFT